MSYSVDDVEVLRGLAIVRRRPELYVGVPLGDRLLPNHLLQEALCVAIHDGVTGACGNVQITLDAHGRAEVEDDGPGWSLARDDHGMLWAEAYMTLLFACRAARTDAGAESPVCRVGLAVLNALSASCVLTIRHGGVVWQQQYVQGAAVTELAPVGSTRAHGTHLAFQLDAALLPQREFATDELVAWLQEHARALTTEVFDRRTGQRAVVAPR